MGQLDVYQNEEPGSSGEIPFLLDIQHDLHRNLRTRVVIPLVRREAQKSALDALCPRLVINDQEVFASIPEMAGYPVQHLGGKIDNLERMRREIFLAVDFLFHGF